MTQQTFTIDTPGQHQLQIMQAGEYLVEILVADAEVELTGVFDIRGSEQCAVNVVIRHSAPHTRANTTFKGVVRDSGFLRLAGRIIIDEDCGDSNSFLTERILLLSDTAKAEAVPDLEIMTDDVKCSHAASISHIPAEHIFYLQSRGIPRQQAEELIVDGFLAELQQSKVE